MKKYKYLCLIEAILFAFIGGFSNVYTYLYRGGIFSNMQTGNLIKFIIRLSNGSFEPLYFVPIISFIIGCIISSLINKLKNSYIINQIIIIAVYLICGFIPSSSILDILTVSIMAFIGAIMFESFNECLNTSYTSIMCTNNMRLFSKSIIEKNYHNVFFYLSIIVFFSIGALVSALLGRTFEIYSISFLSIIVIFSLFITIIKNKNDIINR